VSRESAANEQPENAVSQNQSELCELHFSDVLFPPEVLLINANGREEVVEVHDRVHETVEQRGEEGAAPRHKHHSVPCHESYRRVVIHVQKRNLVEFLSQQHEPCIEKLDEFRCIVPPANREQSIVDMFHGCEWLTEPAEIVRPESCPEEFDQHV